MNPKQCQNNEVRVFAYCHDGVGIGHLARTTAICNRIGQDLPDASFLIATGTPYVTMFDGLKHADYIKLPALVKANNHDYQSKFFSLPSENVMQLRASMLRDSVRFFDPTVVIVDKAPIGVCGELLSALEWLRENRPETRIIFGMRDIEDAPPVTIAQWEELGVPAKLSTLFDEIWVYGVKDIFDVADHYQLPANVQDKLKYVGYVTRSVPTSPVKNGKTDLAKASPYVLVTVGGGTDGGELLHNYLDQAADDLAKQGIRSVLIAGPDLPAEAGKKLQEKALRNSHVEWVPFEPNLAERMCHAEMVVSMGGYNTLCEVAINKKRSLVIPRTQPREEQLIRARLWQDLGILEMIEPADLTPQLLSEKVRHLLKNGKNVSDHSLDLNGLERIAHRFSLLKHKDHESATAIRL